MVPAQIHLPSRSHTMASVPRPSPPPSASFTGGGVTQALTLTRLTAQKHRRGGGQLQLSRRKKNFGSSCFLLLLLLSQEILDNSAELPLGSARREVDGRIADAAEIGAAAAAAASGLAACSSSNGEPRNDASF